MTPSGPQTISVYGIGNFGYALLNHLGRKASQEVKLKAYDRNSALIDNLREHKQHLYLHRSEVVSKDINFVSSPKQLLSDCDVLVLAVSSDATREVMRNIRKHLTKPIVILNTAKALDYRTGKRLSETVQEELPNYSYAYALLAGGTIAHDLFKQEPLGVDIASKDPEALRNLVSVFESNNLSVYPTQDLTGVEYASAFKNILAILAGLVNGLGFSYGAETHLISRTAQHIAEACVNHLGATEKTFEIGSQSWGNDMWMSCTGETRNREFGALLGKGYSVSSALTEMEKSHKTVEGINTVKVLNKIPDIRKIESVELLYELIVAQTIEIKTIKEYLLKTKGSYGGAQI